MLIKGIGQGLLVLLVVAIATLVAKLSHNKSVVELTIAIAIYAGWIVAGYLYKRKHGSIWILSLKEDKNAAHNLYRYVLGIGLVWGPVKLFLGGILSQDIHPLLKLGLFLLSVPMAGMSVYVLLLIGGFFYKDPVVDEKETCYGNFVIVASNLNSAEAHLYKTLLEAAAIPAEVGDANFSRVYGSLYSASVKVPGAFVAEAKEVFAAFKRGDFALDDEFEPDGK